MKTALGLLARQSENKNTVLSNDSTTLYLLHCICYSQSRNPDPGGLFSRTHLWAKGKRMLRKLPQAILGKPLGAE